MMIQVLRISTIILGMCACLEAERTKKSKTNQNNGIKATDSDDWSYYYGTETGPDAWPDNYPLCGGPLQTPIDLPDVDDLYPVGPAPLKLKGYNKKPIHQSFSNDGRTGILEATYKKTPILSGGFLKDKYKFTQLHFHWGESDDLGSEHTVDGEASPLEIHFVHESKTGALAVLGVLTYIDEEHPRDSVLFPLWDEFMAIEKEGDKKKMKKRQMIAIQDFLPKGKSRFYRYMGSTTTPPCWANVTWTIFENKLPISAVDVELLRTWRGVDEELLLNNYRPIQATEDREILLVTQ